jgi:alkyl hydroperoxide reductase subunit D
MSINTLKQQFPDYATDTKVNFGKLTDEHNFEGLTQNQIYAIALASGYATKNKTLINALISEVNTLLSPEEINAAKASASIMAMNNIYYRFIHLTSDPEFAKMPAGLRMTIIGKPGINKVDFELYCLAVSAINGCGMCMDTHVNEIAKAGISKQGIQSSIKIASIINAASQVIDIEGL